MSVSKHLAISYSAVTALRFLSVFILCDRALKIVGIFSVIDNALTLCWDSEETEGLARLFPKRFEININI